MHFRAVFHTSCYWHVSVVLLVGNVGDGLVHGGVELVCDFGLGKGNVVVVVRLVLEIHEELGLLCGHCMELLEGN